MAARSPVQRDADRRLFAQELEEEADRAAFRRDGWACRLLSSRIFAFWDGMAPGIFEGGAEDAAP